MITVLYFWGNNSSFGLRLKDSANYLHFTMPRGGTFSHFSGYFLYIFLRIENCVTDKNFQIILNIKEVKYIFFLFCYVLLICNKKMERYFYQTFVFPFEF